MIEPTYFLACPIFEDGGFRGRLRGIPEGEGEDCVDLEFLLDELSKVRWCGVVFEDVIDAFLMMVDLTDLFFFFLLTGRGRDGLAGSASCKNWTAISAYLQVYFILHDYVYEP